MASRNTLVRDEDFWRNKKIVVVLNLADDSVYSAAVTSTGLILQAKSESAAFAQPSRSRTFSPAPMTT
jgi:hypothetical protein